MGIRRAQTARHSVLCIVMQRAESVPDAFLRFLRQKRAERVLTVRTMRRYGKCVWVGVLAL